MTLTLLVWLAAAAGELRAEHWHNLSSLRVHDDRDVLVAFLDESACRDRRLVRQLNRIHVEGKIRVIGLFRESARDAERLLKRARIKFPAGSGAGETFKQRKIKRAPEILLISRKDESEWAPADLDAVVEPWPDEILQGRITNISDPDLLRDVIESDLPGMTRVRALRKLGEVYGKNFTDAYVEYAESLLEGEGDPWLVGHVRYVLATHRGAADPLDQGPAPSTRALQEYQRDENATPFAAVRTLRTTLQSAAPDAVLEQYRAQRDRSDAPALVARRLIVQELTARKFDPGARAALLEIVSTEPDRSTRLRAVGGLGEVCQPGADPDAADFLAELALIEPSIKHVRPMMEYVSFYLRTGIENPAAMQPADLTDRSAP